jgi:hypothetical protein
MFRKKSPSPINHKLSAYNKSAEIQKILKMPEMLADSTNPIVYLDIKIGKEEGKHEIFLNYL